MSAEACKHKEAETYKIEHVNVPRGWMLTIGETIIPFLFETKKAALAYAKRKGSRDGVQS